MVEQMQGSDRPISFPGWWDIPSDFEGDCCFNDRGVECSLVKGKLFHNPNGPAYYIPDSGYTEWRIKNMRHRLGGPAAYNNGGLIQFWIYDQYYKEQDYWNHPLVVEHKLKEILQSL